MRFEMDLVALSLTTIDDTTITTTTTAVDDDASDICPLAFGQWGWNGCVDAGETQHGPGWYGCAFYVSS